MEPTKLQICLAVLGILAWAVIAVGTVWVDFIDKAWEEVE